MRQKQVKFTQVSLFSVLLSGRYDGVITIGELKKLGNMAIATMDRLDGEMQMIDGVVYQAVTYEMTAETKAARDGRPYPEEYRMLCSEGARIHHVKNGFTKRRKACK